MSSSLLRPVVDALLGLKRRILPVDRSRALREELQFWDAWFATRGLEWPDDFSERFDPALSLQDHVARFVDRVPADPVTILDVGAGPLTKLGKTHPRKRLVITAADLLADEYARLLGERGVTPLVRTVYADVERLTAHFSPNAFDVVHGQNCIDHTSDPLRAIDEMVAVCKPAGFVVLYHAENEGARERYGQLHQWDFTCIDGAFVIADRRGTRTDVSARLAATCEVACEREGDAILASLRKKPSPAV
jgi:SAM-dependent methyltransferase